MTFWVAGAIALGGVSTAVSSSNAAGKAAGAAKSAADASTAEASRQYDQTRTDFAPWRSAGQDALQRLQGLSGGFNGAKYLADNPAVAAAGIDPYQHYLQYGKAEGRQAEYIPPDMTLFQQSPDYQFRLQQGQKAIDNSAAARGGLLSGATVKAGTDYASNLASGEWNNYLNRLMAQAGLGQNATAQTAAAGANTTNIITGAQQNAGNTRASAYMQQGAGVNNAIQGTIGNVMLNRYLGGGYGGGSGYGGGAAPGYGGAATAGSMAGWRSTLPTIGP